MRICIMVARRAVVLGGVAVVSACSTDVPTGPSTNGALAPGDRPALSLTPTSARPTLPQAYVTTTYVAPTGKTITVPAGGSLQSAINSAVPGDVVVLQPGATYTGNFYLPKKSGTGWVTIRTATSDTQLPQGVRVGRATAPLLAKLVTPNSDAALRTMAGAHHYRIVGLEVTTAPAVTAALGLIHLGTVSASAQPSPAYAPSHIILDRLYVHGNSTLDLKNCVTMNAATAAIIDSYVSDCHHKTVESHGIIAINGPGPLKIENNYIEAGHINVMFGGASPASAEMLPSDVEIRRNHITKPLSWKGVWPAKNLVELKIGQRFLFEGNVLENSWYDQQRGFALLFKTSIGEWASAWGITQDVTFRYNIVRRTAGGVSMSARDQGYGLPARRFRFEHNLWEDIGASNGTTYGRMFMVLPGVNTVQFEHNTALHSTTYADALVRFGYGTDSGFVFRDNLTTRGTTGVLGDAATEGTSTLTKWAPGHVFSHNVLVSARSTIYPAGNHFPSGLSSVGFVNLAGRDYRLATTSPYKGKASDGTDPGADVSAVTSKTAGVVR